MSGLIKKNISQSTQSLRDHRPWGWFEVLAADSNFKVKRIFVEPMASLSLQSHKYRSEHWVVVKGKARTTIDSQIRILGKAIVNYKNKIWESAWNSTRRMSRECYSTPYSPSTVISKPEDIDLNLKKIKTEDYEKYKINFGRIDIHIYSLDWLYLVHSGHRRAKFIYDKEVSMVWIAP